MCKYWKNNNLWFTQLYKLCCWIDAKVLTKWKYCALFYLLYFSWPKKFWQCVYVTNNVNIWLQYQLHIWAIYTRRVKRQYGICWLKKKLSKVHGTLPIFFRNKTFLFDLGFRETLQNFSSFRQTCRRHFSMGKKNCPNELKFYEVSRTC